MQKVTIRTRQEETVDLVLAPPDLPVYTAMLADVQDMDKLRKALEKEKDPEILLQSGIFQKVHDYVVKYLPDLCVNVDVGVIRDGVRGPKGAKLYVSATPGRSGDIPAHEEYRVFAAIAEILREVSGSMVQGVSRGETFHGIDDGKSRGPDGDTDEPTSE